MEKSKNNIIKNIIIVMGIYISILIFHNASSVLRKIVFSTNGNLIFLNKTIILSLVITSFVVIYKNILFRKKIYYWVIILFLLICNFAEGFFLDFKVYSFIILYLYLLLMTFFVIIKTKNRFELSIVYSFSILILSAFVAGLFGLLAIFKYIMLLVGVYMIYYIYKLSKKDSEVLSASLNILFSEGFIIFNILWILSILFGAGIYVHSFDEYSHWAYDAKSMIYYSKFGTSQQVMLKTRAYPPIFTVWHYIISIFGGFSEHNLYVGLNMLITIYLLPVFIYFRNNKLIVKILGFISIVYCCYLFGGVYSYTALYVDYAIASVFTSAIIIYFFSKDKNINLNTILLLLLAILTLSKTNGFVIALTLVLIIFINELLENKINRIKDYFKYFILFLKKYKYYILIIFITFFGWKLYLFITSKITTDYYDFQLLPTALKGDLKYKLNYNFIFNFLDKVYHAFDQRCVYILKNLSLYQYLLLSFIFMYVVFYKIVKDSKKAMIKILPYIISYIIFFLVTVLSIFVAMSLYEASNLASFDRYLNWFNLALILFNIFLLLRLKDENNVIFKIVVLSCVVLSVSFSTIFSFIKNPIKSESYSVSIERNDKVKILERYTEPDSFVYVIDQEDKDGIMAMWYVRYYAFPRKTNATASAINWKIKTKKNKDDLRDWGFTAEIWSEHLKKFNFDYVFLYSSDKYFFEKTEFMYDDYEKAKKSTLFKIEIVDDNVKLIPIK